MHTIKTCTMNKPSLTFIVAVKSYHIRTCPEDFRKQKYYFVGQYFMETIIYLKYCIDLLFYLYYISKKTAFSQSIENLS